MADDLGTTHSACPHPGNDNSPSLCSTSCRCKKIEGGGGVTRIPLQPPPPPESLNMANLKN